ncbi:MAG: right-handed parallel beta-helix repeat-containing protein, partial [Phycisphaerales bacterium]|nr:right-handed parallel beta-helix repeat-containing protein [Phycisphaerales bacterium]
MRQPSSNAAACRSLPLAITFLALTASASRAGDLDPPPGPVDSTMKPLDVVEPRIPVGPETTPGDIGNQYIITQTGSYYLTGNISGEARKNGIKVLASDVTLDLGGFTLGGAALSDNGIEVDPDALRFTCRNGTLRDWPLTGVMAEEAGDVRLEGITVATSGGMGIFVYNGIIRDCSVLVAGGSGIYASSRSIIEGCHVRSAGGDGIR